MVEEDPQKLRRRADAYDRLACSITDGQALKALQTMARDYRRRADDLTTMNDQPRRERHASLVDQW